MLRIAIHQIFNSTNKRNIYENTERKYDEKQRQYRKTDLYIKENKNISHITIVILLYFIKHCAFQYLIVCYF